MSIVPGFSHVSEREPGGWYCCANSSAAMAGNWHADIPATLDAAHRIKTASGRQHDGGMSQSDVRKGLAAAYGIGPTASVPPTQTSINNALAAGSALIAQLTYGKLPTRLRRWDSGFSGGHSLAICGVSGGRWGWFDPLAPVGWTGEWVTPAEVLPALWATSLDAFSEGGEMSTTVSVLSAGATGRATSIGTVDLWLPDGTTQKAAFSGILADDVEYTIKQSDGRAPKGGPFRRLAQRPYSGWYVAGAVVTYTPPPDSYNLGVDAASKAALTARRTA